MSRIDRKYWFHLSKLHQILEQTLSEYKILEIDGQRLMEYQTTYFDTPDNSMYMKHHNSKMNRHKIRKRKYISTNSSFLEVKYKTNKKITIKDRVESSFEKTNFLPAENNFIKHETQYSGENLLPVLNNKFTRLTLIHKDKLDRCTIDISPVFWNENNVLKITDLGIFELKRGNSLKSSPIVAILRNLKIRQRGMSKYCTGRAMLESALKHNAFKPRLRFLYKEILN
ncbi:MAG TPA: polyphosphate polymerase domain-containing protein [Draconibacterium sp.]|nr:polyphosphate polymerase domain-containing protein [Draconibacterium sp.]